MVEGVVRAAFAHRRKTIVNSLRTASARGLFSSERIEEALARHGSDRRARAESLSAEQWLGVARELVRNAGE
jgi:16S rRNA A1518/A1519 N6-dimethyltransferase RsmA/KsgA/DIM1 with predicted DNA glycosylase/AP lyase activity